MSKDYSYEYEYDREYCYPGSHVLINKLNIRDANELQIAEREITSLKLAMAKAKPISGKFDLAHLRRIHAYIFGDIYEWAGQLRHVNISKGSQFCLAQNLVPYSDGIFKKLKKANFLIDSNNTPEELAYYLSEINALHPFREGNGRTQRLFIEYLAGVSGYEVDFSEVTPKEMIEASADSFALKYGKVNAMFDRISSPIFLEQQRQNVICCFDEGIERDGLLLHLTEINTQERGDVPSFGEQTMF